MLCKFAIASSIITSVFLSQFVSAAEGDHLAVKPPIELVPENLILMGPQDTHPKHIFIADKSTRTLTVWVHGKDKPHLLGAYPMDIGKLQGDKVLEGDHRTPEGIYFFQERKDDRELDYSLYGRRAFTLDYPNIFDIKAGKTGSGIWLHAVPDTTSLMRGSRGCVVVRNEIIEQLTPLIVLQSTPMLILDKVNYISVNALNERKANLQKWLESWRAAWQSKDIDQYMNHYASDFKALRMTKNKWRKYKQDLNKKYEFINVEIRDPFLVVKSNQAIISFIQDYKSDSLQDFGEKTLYVNQTADGKFEILTEIWKPLSSELIAQRHGGAADPSKQ